MQTSGLILLGTVHSDPSGYARTRFLLSEIQPDLVFVELSPYALHYRKEHAPRLLRELSQNLQHAAHRIGLSFKDALMHPQVRAIRRQIALPFEYRASEAYASHATGVTILAVDWSEFSRQWIETWGELISAENLESLLRLERMQIPVHVQYDRAARQITSGSPVLDPWTGNDFSPWRSREEHIAARIRLELAHRSPRLPIYIGGWRHLLRGGAFKTLRDILGITLSRCFLPDRGAIGRDA